jgi:hypothetical protein
LDLSNTRNGVILTSFPTLETESLAEINLGSTGSDKGFFFKNFGVKIRRKKNCSFVSGRIIVKQKKSRKQNAADEPTECAAAGDQLLL